MNPTNNKPRVLKHLPVRTARRKRKQRPRESRGSRQPRLRFTPYAWAKLLWFRDHGDTEIGGFGIADTDDPLFITDLVTVKQQVTCASVKFDDQAVADFFDAQVDAGLNPQQFSRLWLHSHPGESPEPSPVDEETFERVFGSCDWACMFIVGTTGKTYARLRFGVGPGGEGEISVEVDDSAPFRGSDHEAWEVEYQANVQVGTDGLGSNWFGTEMLDDRAWLDQLDIDEELAEQLSEMTGFDQPTDEVA